MKIFIFLVSAILIFSMIFTIQGCSKLDIEIFGKKFGGETEVEDSETEDPKSTDDKTINDTQDNTENSIDISTKDDIDSDNKSTNTGDIITDNTDISELRSYYAEAMKYYFGDQNQSYLIAEYYLNKVKDSY
ncbi:MAG: hypothetical protein WA105_01075, partial [Candidatus Hydromicrobium sp.]